MFNPILDGTAALIAEILDATRMRGCLNDKCDCNMSGKCALKVIIIDEKGNCRNASKLR